MNGILIVDKPKNFTSFDVVAVVRKCLHEKKTGHTGTLDPMATGILPILIGSATKAQIFLPDKKKEYQAEFQFGLSTDTLDITGKVLKTYNTFVTKQEIENVLPCFRGNIMQKPPMYSAVSKDGVRLYELARKGIEIEREERPVTVTRVELTEYDENTKKGKLYIACSEGTYIRVIIDDIGKKLNSGCVMTDLRRTRACGFGIEDSIPLETIRTLPQSEIEKLIRPVDSLFSHLKSVSVSQKQTVRFQNGGSLMLSRLRGIEDKTPQTLYRVYGFDGTFLGLGEIAPEKDELSVKKRF